MLSEGMYGRHRDNVAGRVGIKPFLIHIWLSNPLERRFVQTDPVRLEDPGHREGRLRRVIIIMIRTKSDLSDSCAKLQGSLNVFQICFVGATTQELLFRDWLEYFAARMVCPPAISHKFIVPTGLMRLRWPCMSRTQFILLFVGGGVQWWRRRFSERKKAEMGVK